MSPTRPSNVRIVGNCEWETVEGGFVCSVCGTKTTRVKKRNCHAKFNPDADISRGVGNELERVLRGLGVSKVNGCGCDNLKNALNAMGPDEVERHADEVAKKLQRQAAKRKWLLSGSVVSYAIARGLIAFAVMRARARERNDG
jgi:hypothetical protein